jgi:DNA mismatch repair protein MutS
VQGEEEIVFLRRLVPGGANRSYGLAVARLAGLPQIVLARARTMLDALEASGNLPVEGASAARGNARQRRKAETAQLDIFGAAQETPDEPEAVRTLRALDVDHMTPIEALVALARLKQLLPPR